MRCLPTQLTPVDGGVIISRGATSFVAQGEQAAEAARRLMTAALDPEGITAAELAALFPPADADAVNRLVSALKAKRILVPVNGSGPSAPAEESALDVFYWTLGVNGGPEAGRLARTPVVIIGLNGISRRMVAALAEGGARNVTVVDFPLLRNLTMFGKGDEPDLDGGRWPGGVSAPVPYSRWKEGESSPGAMVGTCDFGGPAILRDWNRYAVAEKIFFLPVTVNRGTGLIGPLVAPGETPCLECLLVRENANLTAPAPLRALDAQAFAGQLVAPLHPTMAPMAADAAVMELTRFFDFPWLWRKGTATEMDLVATAVRRHTVYKIPRCPVCGNGQYRSPFNIQKEEFDGGYSLIQRLQELSGVPDA